MIKHRRRKVGFRLPCITESAAADVFESDEEQRSKRLGFDEVLSERPKCLNFTFGRAVLP